MELLNPCNQWISVYQWWVGGMMFDEERDHNPNPWNSHQLVLNPFPGFLNKNLYKWTFYKAL